MKHFIPLIFLSFIGCKQELPTIPKDVIPIEEMESILSDMHIADALAETKAQAGEDERTLTISYHEQIYKNHGITHNEFVKSFKFYESNSKLLNKIYDELLMELSKRSAEINKQ